MNFTTYKDAITELAIPKLTAFLATQTDVVEIEGWSKMRAPEKRDQLLEAFKQSPELRKEFVPFYGETSGKDADFSEWELASAEADEPEIIVGTSTPADGPDAPVSTQADPIGDTVEEANTGKGETLTGQALTSHDAGAMAKGAHSAFVEGAFEAIVADVAGLDAQQSKMNLTEAEDRMEFEHIRIGAILSHIQHAQHYITLGYDNLREFLNAETAMDYRKGTYLISNYNRVRDLGIQTEDLKGVTWSALRHVVPILTTKNAKKWLDAARSNTHVKLIEQVAKEKAKQAGALSPPTDNAPAVEEVKTSNKTFNLYPEQSLTVNAALEKAKGQANLESNGAALEVIAAAYTGSPISDATIAMAHPDTSEAGFMAMFSKMKAEGGNEALIPILTAIGTVWDDVDITASFPDAVSAAAE